MEVEDEPPLESIKSLWAEHNSLPFPSLLRGSDIDGIDFVMLDADIAGCVSSFLSRGTLNAFQAATLGLCYHNARFVAPVLYEEGAEYIWRLYRLAELVLREVIKFEKK